jgi:hypothetical protein
MVMTAVDMKQKIKEVRDKFLSNNQIEDIRQNITLGVEERLKFLNSEQIKVVELLEEKHRELDIALQTQSKKIDEDKKAIESAFASQVSILLEKYEHESIKLERQSEQFITEQTELEKKLDEKFKNALKGQLAFIDDSLDQVAKEHTEFKEYVQSMEQNFSIKVEENNTLFKELSNKNLEQVETNKKMLLEKLEEKGTDIINTVDDKLLVVESEKKEFLHITTEKFNLIASNLEEKIEDFLKNHKSVEDVIDSRLNEFRTAQKAAFEELEAALNLLEKHQDDTLTRFRQKSETTNLHGQNRQTNLPNSFVKNRGSILYQSDHSSNSSLPIVEEFIDTTVAKTQKKSSGKLFKPIIIALTGSIVLLGVMHYFNISYGDFINLSSASIK